MTTRPLGRLTPTDFAHVDHYALDASALVVPKPVVIGINWYSDFDTPVQVKDGSYHLPSAKNIKGKIRGGHCVCLGQMGFNKDIAHTLFLQDLQKFYNQLLEGACEGFGHCHAQSLEHGGKYDAFLLYDNARRVEGSYPSGEGATNKGAVEAMLKFGVSPQTLKECVREQGDLASVKPVKSVSYTKDVGQILTALGRENASAIPLLNSWGLDYPMIVWIPVDTLARLMAEDGEADACTDN